MNNDKDEIKDKLEFLLKDDSYFSDKNKRIVTQTNSEVNNKKNAPVKKKYNNKKKYLFLILLIIVVNIGITAFVCYYNMNMGVQIKGVSNLYVNEYTYLSVKVDENSLENKKVVWTSSDESVATIDSSGRLTAIKDGTTTIKARIGLKRVSLNFVVKKMPTNSTEMCTYLKEKNRNLILYEDFEKVVDNKDDYYMIKAAHECANELNVPVRATNNAIYNIYNKNNEGTIKVKTSTDFNNSTIYIHDESEIIGKPTALSAIFTISNDSKIIKLTNKQISTLKSKMKVGTTKISELSGYGDALVEVVNSKKKQFIRLGSNANDGSYQKEYLKVDNEGNIKNEIMWNYSDVTSVKIYNIPSNELIIENGNFVTIAATSLSNTKTGYTIRGISVNRSNTKINKINHTVVNSKKEEIESISYNYIGFLNLNLVSDVIVKDCNLYALITTNTLLNSTYDLAVSNAVNIVFDSVMIPGKQLSGNYWGVMGGNYIKDATFKNCILNRIDVHSGVQNLTIKDSILGNKGIVVVGAGKLEITNTKVIGAPHFITLRNDYGSWWNGTIEITNSTYIPPVSNFASLIFSSVSFEDDLIHNFGYDLVLPNVKINGLKIEGNFNKFFIFNNANTDLLKGDLSLANNYTGGKFKYILPTSIRYSNIVSNSSLFVSKYRVNF